MAYENLENLSAAAVDMEVAIPLSVYTAPLLEKRGTWRLKARRFEEALADFDEAITQGHASVDVAVGRGTALRELGSSAEALAVFSEAVRSFPNAVTPRLQRAITLAAEGEFVAARRDSDWIIDNRPDHYLVSRAFAIRAATREPDDSEGAHEDLQQALGRSRDASQRAEFEYLIRQLNAGSEP